MRNFIDIINSTNTVKLREDSEPKYKTKTASATDELNIDLGLSKGELAPSAADFAPAAPADTTRPGRAAKARPTIKPMEPQASMFIDNLKDLGLDDDISDEEAAFNAGISTDGATPEPTTPENLPAVMSSAVAAAGHIPFEPEWHMVRHLPGYLQAPIRALGRQIFSPFTDTPIEDIQVLCTLTNPENEVKMMMSWIRKNGIRDDQAEMDFSNIMPGYSANTQIWSTEGYQFMLVQDPMGYYVYGWPGGRGVHIGAAPAARRLR